MIKITLIAGLPGSGKSFLGTEMAKNGSSFIDDISMIGIVPLENAIKKYEHIIIADVFLCEERTRELAVKRLKSLGIKKKEIEWIFFENNPEKCLKNVERRDDGRKVKLLIEDLSKDYVIPVGAEVRTIWSEEII